MKQECATCKWSEFKMTKHNPPRVDRRQYGECRWTLPEVILIAACYSKVKPQKFAIWPDQKDCPVWEPKPPA